MEDKKLKRYQQKIEVLEKMLEEKTRELYLINDELISLLTFNQSIIDSISEIVLVLDGEGFIKFINKPGVSKLGHKVSKKKKKNIRDFISDDVIKELKEGNEVECLLKLKKDLVLPVSIIRSHLKAEHSIEGDEVVYLMKDLTARKFAEKKIEEQRLALIQSTRLASLGEMASGIAHEINNPVTIIEGQIRRAQKILEQVPFDKGKVLELTQKMHDNLMRVVNIVKGLRIMSRKSDHDPFEILSAEKILKVTKELCQEKFKNHDAKLLVGDVDSTIKVSAREGQVLQILINLISNSFDAIEKYEKRWVELKVEVPSQDFIDFRVTDSGNGIAAETIQRMFEPFYTTKEVGKGTGIGLSISHKMAQENKGELIYDAGHANTCFVLRLPRSS